eukprot:6204015-Pleurochrysis_carterae.AAC.6
MPFVCGRAADSGRQRGAAGAGVEAPCWQMRRDNTGDVNRAHFDVDVADSASVADRPHIERFWLSLREAPRKDKQTAFVLQLYRPRVLAATFGPLL